MPPISLRALKLASERARDTLAFGADRQEGPAPPLTEVHFVKTSSSAPLGSGHYLGYRYDLDAETNTFTQKEACLIISANGQTPGAGIYHAAKLTGVHTSSRRFIYHILDEAIGFSGAMYRRSFIDATPPFNSANVQWCEVLYDTDHYTDDATDGGIAFKILQAGIYLFHANFVINWLGTDGNFTISSDHHIFEPSAVEGPMQTIPVNGSGFSQIGQSRIGASLSWVQFYPVGSSIPLIVAHDLGVNFEMVEQHCNFSITRLLLGSSAMNQGFPEGTPTGLCAGSGVSGSGSNPGSPGGGSGGHSIALCPGTGVGDILTATLTDKTGIFFDADGIILLTFNPAGTFGEGWYGSLGSAYCGGGQTIFFASDEINGPRLIFTCPGGGFNGNVGLTGTTCDPLEILCEMFASTLCDGVTPSTTSHCIVTITE